MLSRRSIALFFLMATPAMAQVKLGFKVEPTVALQYERVGAELTIQNNADRPMDSSSNGNCRVSYIVRRADGSMLSAKDGIPPMSVLVPPARTLTFADALSQRYDLGPVGAYTIQARVEMGDYIFSSEKRYVDIVPGTEIESLDAQTEQGERKYMLRLVNRDKHDRIFLRIDDNRVCYGVFDLGRIVRMSSPEMKVDAAGAVHILHQSSPHEYSYAVFKPDGTRVSTEHYGDNITRAQMVTGDQGEVRIETIQVATQNEIKPLETAPLKPRR